MRFAARSQLGRSQLGRSQPGRAATLTVSGLLVGVLAGCGLGTDTASDAEITVVTSVYPLEWLAEEIVTDIPADVAVTNLTEPGLDPHDLELSPQQIGEIGEADLVFYIEGMQPAVDDAVAEHVNDQGTALNVADVVSLREAEPQEQEEGEPDPHMWLDTERFAAAGTAFAEQLTDAAEEADTDADADVDAATEAAEGVSAELAEIDEEYQDSLADCELRSFVVSHAAFGYLAERYDLEQISIAGIEPETEPSPARIREVADVVEDAGVDTIFTETLASPQVAETVAAETGTSVEVLDALEGLTEDSPGEDYPSVMHANLAELEAALGCTRD